MSIIWSRTFSTKQGGALVPLADLFNAPPQMSKMNMKAITNNTHIIYKATRNIYEGKIVRRRRRRRLEDEGQRGGRRREGCGG